MLDGYEPEGLEAREGGARVWALDEERLRAWDERWAPGRERWTTERVLREREASAAVAAPAETGEGEAPLEMLSVAVL